MPAFAERRDLPIAYLAGALVLVPVVVDLGVRGLRAAITYLAHDAFYYLAVGKHVATLGRFSFDGERPTSGFHPLWQLAVALLEQARRLGGWSELDNLGLVVTLSALLVATAVVLLGLTLARAYGGLSPLYLLVGVGALGPVLSAIHPRMGTLYVFVNGMETPLVLLGYAFTLAAAVRFEPGGPGGGQLRAGLRLGAALAFLVLARLDHFLLALMVLALFGLRAWRLGRPALAAPLAAAGLLGLVLALEAAFSHYALGTLVPVSGAAKSSFPYPKLGNTLRWIGADWSPDTQGRLAQLFLPLPIAGLDLLLRARRWWARGQASGWDTMLGAWSAFTLLLGGYNALFVPLYHQGSWYFASVLLHTSVLLYDRGRLWRQALPAGSRRGLLAGLTAATVAWFVFAFHRDDPNQRIFTFIAEERAPLLAHYRAHEGRPGPRLLSVDDGLLTYLTPFPTLSGVGLMLDVEAHQRRRRGESLLAIAHGRGFDRFASWYYGASLAGLPPDADERTIRQRLDRVPWFWDELRAHGHRFRFWVEYASPSRRMFVLRFAPRAP